MTDDTHGGDRLGKQLAQVGRSLARSEPVSVSEVIGSAAQTDHGRRSPTRWLVAAGCLALLVPLAIVLSNEDDPTRLQADDTKTAGGTSTTLPGLQAQVMAVDGDSIKLTLVNSGPEVTIGAYSHFTASVETEHPQLFQLRIVAPSGWYEVEDFDSILQAAAGTMPTGEQAVLPVDLPPGIGPGPHLLRVGYSVVGGDQDGMEDVLFTLPDD